MARDWEASFASWAKPPGTVEQERIENAVIAVRKALQGDPKTASTTKVYVQGSYRNRVNVRQDSDVDIGVLYTGNSFDHYYPAGITHSTVGNIAVNYSFVDFKEDVRRALGRHFGNAVHRGNKAFDIHENTYRWDADVVPVFVHRHYLADHGYICGVAFWCDDGSKIINWPERLYDDSHWLNQHYENGVEKNTATGRCYKGVVRILKSLRNEMDDRGMASARSVLGFLIECLVWNAPKGCFANGTWDADVQLVLANLWSATRDDASCNEWMEVSGHKYLFKFEPSSKRQQAHAFIDAAWSYIGVR